jgi:hypothetical protein
MEEGVTTNLADLGRPSTLLVIAACNLTTLKSTSGRTPRLRPKA